MLMILILLLLFNSLIFTQMKHPMSMGLILLLQTIFTALYTGLISKTFWFSYILFLIFVGGMLILFIYMASLSPNEKLFFKFNMIYFMMSFFFIMLFFSDNFFLYFMKENNFMEMFILINNNLLNISKLYEMPNNFITLMMISYLLLTLIIIVKITHSYLGPLRMKN